MSIELLLLFLPACFALNLAPGPNNLLSVVNGSRYGFFTACLAGLGRLAAFVGMIALAAIGLAVVLQASQLLFLFIKVAGALYLFYLATQLWKAPAIQQSTALVTKSSLFALAKQEFLVAAGNPKAILIFTAFLPQFVEPGKAVAEQFLVLGGLFLLLEWLAIAIYAWLGCHMQRWFASAKRQQLFNRWCAALLGLAGVGLLMARRM